MRWSWKNLPIECANGPQKFAGEFGRPWLAVTEKRTFEGEARPKPPREGFARVDGGFPRKWKRAKGTFEVEGDTSAGDDCASKVVYWSAARL